MSDLHAYRSDKPEVIAAWLSACDALEAYMAATDEILRDAGLGAYPVLRFKGWNFGEFAGIEIPDGQKVPAGWWKPGSHAVPDKRTKAGKAVGTAIGAVKYPGNRAAQLPGMPPFLLTGGRHWQPGVRLLEDGRALYVTWGSDPVAALGRQGRQDDLDTAIWRSVPLSEYYAAVEQADSAKARDGAS